MVQEDVQVNSNYLIGKTTKSLIVTLFNNFDIQISYKINKIINVKKKLKTNKQEKTVIGI